MLDKHDNQTLEKMIGECREQIEENPDDHFRIGKWNLMIKKIENELNIRGILGIK